MPWRQLSLKVAAAQTEAVEDLLLEMGAVALTLEDASGQPLLEPGPGETPLWAQVHLHSLFEADAELALVAHQLGEAGFVDDPTSLVMKTVEDQAWERVWMDRFKPMRFGERLWIYPRHHDAPESGDDRIVRLDPGLAFGSGTHPTTAMCLAWLDGADLSGKIVVDYGCGSGVLAIAAALCGAEKVWCVDHDEQALIATRENAEVNGVLDRVVTCHPDELPVASSDVVLANILAGILCELSPRLMALMKPQAQLVMSGMLHTQADDVQRHYADAHLNWQHQQLEDWTLLVGQR